MVIPSGLLQNVLPAVPRSQYLPLNTDGQVQSVIKIIKINRCNVLHNNSLFTMRLSVRPYAVTKRFRMSIRYIGAELAYLPRTFILNHSMSISNSNDFPKRKVPKACYECVIRQEVPLKGYAITHRRFLK